MLKEPLTGETLEKRLEEKITHTPFIEQFLYKDASLMIYAPPSVGKSVLSIQVALQLASGLPVFGALHVPEPKKVWYVQMERSDTESLERIQFMSSVIPVNSKNLVIDTELQKLSFLNPDHLNIILKRGKSISADVMMVDPLYGIASGLSKDEIASSLVKILTILKSELGLTLYLNHHPTKDTYSQDGSKIDKEDPFYGSIWLKAHVTGSYGVEKTEEGCKLKIKKDSHSQLLEELDLSFDPETYISTLDSSKLQYEERFKMFLNARFRSQKRTFSGQEMMSNLGCAIRTFRRLMAHPLFKDSLINVNSIGRKGLYEVVKEVK